MPTLKKSLLTFASMAAVAGLIALAPASAVAQMANPCAPAAQKMGNPCAKKMANPCAKKAANPCAKKASNPCAANPCKKK